MGDTTGATMTAGRLINKPLPSIHTNTGAFATAYRCWNNVTTNTVNSQPSSPDVASGHLTLLGWTSDALDISIEDFKIPSVGINVLPMKLDSSPQSESERRKCAADIPYGASLCAPCNRKTRSRSRVDGSHVHVHGDRTSGSSMHSEIELGNVDFTNL